MQGADLSLFGIDGIRATRCGYTGEDGFELSIPAESVEELTKKLIEDGALLAGLGARDTLRLEAGLCLYGKGLKVNLLKEILIGKAFFRDHFYPQEDLILIF